MFVPTLEMISRTTAHFRAYFEGAGFGSRATTLKDAKEKDSSIKMSDVERLKQKDLSVGIIVS